MKSGPGGLGPPEYRGPGRPLKIERPSNLKYVREGRYCGRCRGFTHSDSSREFLIKSGFWDKLMKSHSDGSDVKGWMIGDPKMYGICEHRSCAAHFFAKACREFAEGVLLRSRRGGVLK